MKSLTFSSWLSDLEQLSRNDGYDDWRNQENKDLTSAVRKTLTQQQNPTNCNNTKILKCYPYGAAGWGM